jgi:hypothetical protein
VLLLLRLLVVCVFYQQPTKWWPLGVALTTIMLSACVLTSDSLLHGSLPGRVLLLTCHRCMYMHVALCV